MERFFKSTEGHGGFGEILLMGTVALVGIGAMGGLGVSMDSAIARQGSAGAAETVATGSQAGSLDNVPDEVINEAHGAFGDLSDAELRAAMEANQERYETFSERLQHTTDATERANLTSGLGMLGGGAFLLAIELASRELDGAIDAAGEGGSCGLFCKVGGVVTGAVRGGASIFSTGISLGKSALSGLFNLGKGILGSVGSAITGFFGNVASSVGDAFSSLFGDAGKGMG
ncbi:MAG: hypothetical protein KC416_16565, partial [Myxococcales bacterium]|nr:hypothetical protein [Myxococcales bacterium]